MFLLADLTVKATVVLATTAGIVWAMRRSSSGARALVWSCGIVAVLALPVVSALVPAWQIPLLPASAIASPSAGPLAAVPPGEASRLQKPPELLRATLHGAGEALRPDTPSEPARRAALIGLRATGVDGAPPTEGEQAHRGELLLVAWATGAVLLLGQLLAGLARVAWIDRRACPVTNGPLHSRLRSAARRLGIRQRVILLESDAIAVPVTWQLFHPRVLVPRGMQSWSADCQTAVLLHELAHVRRRDYGTQLAAHLAVTLYWFNPLVWLARRGLYSEREHACDDAVLHAGVRPSTYAAHLVEVARSVRQDPQPSVAIALMRSSRLHQRVQAILDPATGRTSPNRRTIVSFASVALALVIPLAALQPMPLEAGASPRAETPTMAPVPATPVQQPDPTLEQLIKMRIHGISPGFIEEMSDVFGPGLDIEQLVKLRIHGVSGEFARDMRSAFGADMQMQDLITARIHGVSAEFAGGMSTLLGEALDFEQLKTMRIHGVSAELVDEMNDVFGTQLDVDDLVKLRIHGVSGSYARAMRSAFGEDLQLEHLVAARIHGISPEYAAAMSSSLAEDLSFDTLKRLRIHGVSTELLQELRDAGYDNLTAKDLIDIRTHGMERILLKRNGDQQ